MTRRLPAVGEAASSSWPPRRSLVAANGPWADAYQAVRDASAGPVALHLDLTVGDWAKDGLLALFFFVAMLGGVGFTVSLLIAELALDGEDVTVAKGPVLVASMVAAGLLWRRSRAHEE